MDKLKAIVVDDEMAARNVLASLLDLSHPEINVVDSCSNLPEAVMSIRSRKPDVVFLDVEMPQFSGYEISKFFDQIDFQIVFVTAYDKYAIKAFEINAVDYLLKPIRRERLSEAVSKLVFNHQQRKELLDYKRVLTELMEKDSPTIVLSETGKKQVVKTVDIVAVSAKAAYSEFHLKNGSRIIVSRNIGAIENELSIDDRFFRTHKSWIVNLDEIQTINSASDNILLKNGKECKLSRFKKAEFKRIFNAYIERD